MPSVNGATSVITISSSPAPRSSMPARTAAPRPTTSSGLSW